MREDGWLEIELGEYFVGFDEEELEMSVLETREGGWKGGIFKESRLGQYEKVLCD